MAAPDRQCLAIRCVNKQALQSVAFRGLFAFVMVAARGSGVLGRIGHSGAGEARDGERAGEGGKQGLAHEGVLSGQPRFEAGAFMVASDRVPDYVPLSISTRSAIR